MQAMILAAGFGTRLLPHTLLRPKPLFPILNRPLLLLTISRLRNSGFDRIVVNCHHLGEQIVDLLHGMAGVTVLLEETILGTGGGLRGAAHPSHAPLLVTNGDIYHDFDFRRLYAGHRERGNRVSLAVHDYPRFNTVRVEAGRGVTDIGTSGENCLAFTGLHVIDPEVLEDIAPGRLFLHPRPLPAHAGAGGGNRRRQGGRVLDRHGDGGGLSCSPRRPADRRHPPLAGARRKCGNAVSVRSGDQDGGRAGVGGLVLSR